MRSGNLGRTGLRRRRRDGCPMADYDRLPADLRVWLAAAALPWSPRSVARAFAKALARHPSDRAAALTELDRLQERRLATAAEGIPAASSGRLAPVPVERRPDRRRARPHGQALIHQSARKSRTAAFWPL
ncbi:DUF6525 family protein [Amaricoccus sp.]|uniref:DUF6525 family protein n=1 Tax=Amaricoccus sp. TaxID=1872485 RepID=UPI002D1F9D8F|nr:DUF6525 family protein [Amaricoccus sp.]